MPHGRKTGETMKVCDSAKQRLISLCLLVDEVSMISMAREAGLELERFISGGNWKQVEVNDLIYYTDDESLYQEYMESIEE